ncbi:Gamma-glutamylcyclotransferase [Sulfidibacter corallicola]|uniref:glutathione-specific gamma-glutamylcyclotransferase n=1 Tax=Sulfidibacter corallicola TaxID=2818388 RepID=A0A8A4TNL1_SULCO|nr:gamma-glutamylcyclotransferase [Sulfidibacter corallicola]QTD51569.1 gamma-glutamylcyclotransferase [Sulfidibacter corallicola]
MLEHSTTQAQEASSDRAFDGLSPEHLWVFGYGSIIWRPNFDYLEKRVGYISGWTRKFYQGSPDHRGVPEAPGRVATLLPQPEQECWGVAFRLAPHEARDVLAQLDHREQGGYDRLLLPFHTHAGPTPFRVLVYIASESNPHYLGPAPVSAMANQIAMSHGASGPNSEYLLRLAESLRHLRLHDAHVFELEAHLRSLLSHFRVA